MTTGDATDDSALSTVPDRRTGIVVCAVAGTGPRMASSLWAERLVLCVPNIIVTWRDHPIEGITDLVDALEMPMDLPWITTTSDLVSSLCAKLSADAFGASQNLRRRIDDIDSNWRRDGEIDDGEINAAESRLQVIDEIAGGYSHVFPMLRDTASDAIDLTGRRQSIQVAIDNADGVTRRVQPFYERLSQLHQRQLEFSNDKMNRRLGLLSVLSAIFLPSTLLTGIFGMNFIHMPGLSFVGAYPALLILMVIIGAGLWQYFKRDGWI